MKTWEALNSNSGGALEERSVEMRFARPGLSVRESRILALGEKGLSNGEIAEVLDLSVGTVDNHTSNIRHKLHAMRKTKFRDLIPPPSSENKKPEEEQN